MNKNFKWHDNRAANTVAALLDVRCSNGTAVHAFAYQEMEMMFLDLKLKNNLVYIECVECVECVELLAFSRTSTTLVYVHYVTPSWRSNKKKKSIVKCWRVKR